MPRISLAGGPPVTSSVGSTSVRVNPNMFAAEGEAADRLGRVVNNAAQNGFAQVQDFQAQKQKLVDNGRLSAEDSARLETEGVIKTRIENAKNDPASWGEIQESAWTEYEDGRAQRVKDEGWSAQLAARDYQEYKSYRTRSQVSTSVLQNQIQIRKANAQIEANADALLRNGDYEGFVAQMDKMNVYDDQKEEKIRQGLEAGLYKIANNDIDKFSNLAPVAGNAAYKDYIAQLNEKGEDGKYTNFEYDRGGLSLGGRKNLESIAMSRIRENERQMAITGRKIVGNIRLGRQNLSDITGAVAAGQMSPEEAVAIDPEARLALREFGDRVEAKKEREEEKQLGITRQQEASVQRLTGDIGQGTLSNREIERELALGRIDPAQASVLRERLQQASSAEQVLEKGQFRSLSDRVKSDYGRKVLGVTVRDTADDAEYQKLVSDISQSSLTKPSRLALMSQVFDLKLADVNDLEEEGPSSNWGDREITANERGLRKNMITAYKERLPALGDTVAGDLLLSQEAQIRTFFDSAPPNGRSTTEVDNFYKQMMGPVNHAAAKLSLEEAFKF